jgi:hypothetical protein
MKKIVNLSCLGTSLVCQSPWWMTRASCGKKALAIPIGTAVRLSIGFVVMNIINPTVFMRLSEDVPWRQSVLPFFGIFMMLCGLAAGVVGLIAILRKHERSWLVWLTILPGTFALFRHQISQ